MAWLCKVADCVSSVHMPIWLPCSLTMIDAHDVESKRNDSSEQDRGDASVL